MLKIKIIVKTVIFLLSVVMLTACTGKEELAFELDGQSGVQEAEYAAGAGDSSYELGLLTEASAGEETADRTLTGAETVGAAQADTPAVIYVHICGAVVNPGVYELDEGSRVFEGIEAAGGFSEDASTDYVNQAQPLKDGQRLIIPTLEEVEAAKESGLYKEPWSATDTGNSDSGAAADMGNPDAADLTNSDGRININTAGESELSTIDGIGAGKAAAIVKYRQENGNFQSIEDIMKVSGIKEGTYAKIKDKITVK
ncbi:MAG: helix-hairpin-helix domain-containing protein [Clostridiales bacterium]|nr:helix-hairpin-helix domain-containing protein [Clostridiales bacterium]